MLGPGFLGSKDESWLFARLSFVLLDPPEAVRRDIERALNRHTGACTAEFDDEVTTHFVVFGSWKKASAHPDVLAAKKAGPKKRGGVWEADVRIVHISFVLESIRKGACEPWQKHDAESSVISPMWNWFDDGPAAGH